VAESPRSWCRNCEDEHTRGEDEHDGAVQLVQRVAASASAATRTRRAA
jgi:hypothetical protein